MVPGLITCQEATRHMGSTFDQEGDVSSIYDEFDFTVQSSIYTIDAAYNADAVVLLWEGIATNPDAAESFEQRILFPAGKGFFAADAGARVVHEKWVGGVWSEGSPYFKKNNMINEILQRCNKEYGIRAVLEAKGDAFDAGIWTGLSFHMKKEDRDFGNPHLMPTAFLGVIDLATGTVGAATGVVNDAAAKLAALKATTNGNGAASLLRDQVIAIFKAEPDYQTALGKVVNLDGLTEDAGLVDEVMNEAGLFAQVKAGAAV